MQQITDEQMQQMLMQTKEYTLVLLKSVPGIQRENIQQILWEHGRRNFQLRAEGLISIVGPVTEEHLVAGFADFNTGVEKAIELMKEDPAVKEGIFLFEAVPIRSFPGDSLPS
jgi:hypothetical protein